METLAALVRRNGPLDPLDAAGWAVRLAKRVEELHRLGVAHGAISAECIRADDRSCRARGTLLDVRDSPVLASYHSPERLAGGGISLFDDTWAVAVTLHFLSAGDLPFAGDSPPEVAASIASGRASLRGAGGPLGAALDRIIASHLIPEKGGRAVAIAALRREVEAIVPAAEQVAALPPLEEAIADAGDTYDSTAGDGDDDDDDDDDDAATVMRDFTDIRAQLRRGEVPGPPPSEPPPDGLARPRPAAGQPAKTEELPAVTAPPRIGVPAPGIPRPGALPRTQPLPAIRSSTVATAVRTPPGAPRPGGPPSSSPAVPPGVPPLGAPEPSIVDERTHDVPGRAQAALTRPMSRVSEDEVRPPQQAPDSAPDDEAGDDDDDAALATMVMAGLDASELSSEVEAQLAARGLATDRNVRMGEAAPSPAVRPAAGMPAGPPSPPGPTEPGLPASLSAGAPESFFHAPPADDEPKTQALIEPDVPGGYGGYPLGGGPGAGPVGYPLGPPAGQPPTGAATAGAVGQLRPAGAGQTAPWMAAQGPGSSLGMPDQDELDALEAQDRRLRRMLGIAIVVLVLVLGAVVMLWLRRMGVVAF